MLISLSIHPVVNSSAVSGGAMTGDPVPASSSTFELMEETPAESGVYEDTSPQDRKCNLPFDRNHL